jgi:hypothetical protein
MKKSSKIGFIITSIILLILISVILYIYILIDNLGTPTYNHLTIDISKHKETIYVNYVIPAWMNSRITYQISNLKDIVYDDTYYDSTAKNVLIIEQELEPLYYFISNDTLTFFVQSNSRIHNNLKCKTKIIIKDLPVGFRYENIDQRPLVKLEAAIINVLK